MTTTTKQEFQRITEPPNFGIDDIKKAIPQECFNRKAGKSLYYFFRDYFLIAAIYYVMIWHVEPFILHLNQPFKILFS